MSASDEIKEAIVSYFAGTGVQSNKSDWKRTDKRTTPNGQEFREFHNKKLNRTVYTLGNEDDAEDGDLGIVEKDQWIYGMGPVEERMKFGGQIGNYYICFEPQDRFLRTGACYDQHQQNLLQTLFDLPDNIGEDMENSFTYASADYNDLTIHMKLKKLGFKFSKEYSAWLVNHISPTTSATGPDLNAWEPAFLDPNYSGSLVPASTSSPSANTGTITKFTNKNPGQVFAAQQAQLRQQQAGMMAAIGQMAGQLGATGGVQIGSTHIPAIPPGVMNPIHLPKLPPSGIFNSPGMQTAMPLMAGQWPELAKLQPAVQAAFVLQRSAGLTGLDQADPSWIDKDDLEKLFFKYRGQQHTIQIERSNAIWMLYEEMDQGGYILEDLFIVPNDEFEDQLDSWGFLDQMDWDEHDLEIIDDRQPYPAPYDLPVPQPQPAPPPPPQQHRAPMVGPASMNARAGSFAPVQAPPAAAPPPPPPGNASAQIRNDAGDKWPEFCKEVWDTYETNKGNLPLDVTWYDRYRDREAQITGLGYEFERTEYTGIRVRMGYLGRDGELIENIDLPSAVLADLLKEWGGEWNVDDVTQMIHKRKGTKPDGFTYSAEELWEEVKPFLDSEGWKEAK